MATPLDPIEEYLALIPGLEWRPVDLMTWRQIVEEGLDHDNRNRYKWSVAMLPISETDQAGLRAFNAETSVKFDRLKRRLLDRTGGRIMKLLDHGNGQVRLVQSSNSSI